MSTTLVMSLGELFKQTRRATGMTQTELSERSGIQKKAQYPKSRMTK
ncbi:hypothetical protein M3661_03895 [Paenibacillus sp. MER 180]|nr:hypothetical protein [Paenibacillus sp. MER 180]MCM3289267.1 hypothetical protein [Paenibacillus sp. MER 180]